MYVTHASPDMHVIDFVLARSREAHRHVNLKIGCVLFLDRKQILKAVEIVLYLRAREKPTEPVLCCSSKYARNRDY